MHVWVTMITIQNQWKRPWHTCHITWMRIRSRMVTKWCLCHRQNEWKVITAMRRVTLQWTVWNWKQRKKAKQKQNWLHHNLCVGTLRMIVNDVTEFQISKHEFDRSVWEKCKNDRFSNWVHWDWVLWRIDCEWDCQESSWRLNEQMRMSKCNWI